MWFYEYSTDDHILPSGSSLVPSLPHPLLNMGHSWIVATLPYVMKKLTAAASIPVNTLCELCQSVIVAIYTQLECTITRNMVNGQELCLALWESKKSRRIIFYQVDSVNTHHVELISVLGYVDNCAMFVSSSILTQSVESFWGSRNLLHQMTTT